MKNILLIALFASFTVAGQAGSVSLTSPGVLTPGSDFDVAVQLSGVFDGLAPGAGLLGYGFTVTVGDTSIVSFTGETASPFALDVSDAISPVVGGIFFPALGPGDFAEPLTLATLHFHAVTAGSTTISLSSVDDGNQGLTFDGAALQDISASVTTVAADTPEPSTVTMGMTTLAVFALALRKKRLEADSAAV